MACVPIATMAKSLDRPQKILTGNLYERVSFKCHSFIPNLCAEAASQWLLQVCGAEWEESFKLNSIYLTTINSDF